MVNLMREDGIGYWVARGMLSSVSCYYIGILPCSLTWKMFKYVPSRDFINRNNLKRWLVELLACWLAGLLGTW
jgi:hypothetical protein